MKAALTANLEAGSVIGARVIVGARGIAGITEDSPAFQKKLRGTLPNLSPTLGKRWSGNGDMLFGGNLRSRPCEINPTIGPGHYSGADFSTADHGTFI
jgi:hypothetical protein